jgi:hypothetical protein
MSCAYVQLSISAIISAFCKLLSANVSVIRYVCFECDVVAATSPVRHHLFDLATKKPPLPGTPFQTSQRSGFQCFYSEAVTVASETSVPKASYPVPMATTGLRSMETTHKTIVILRCKLILVGKGMRE